MNVRRAAYLVAFVALLGLSAPLVSSSQQATLEISKVSPSTVLPGNTLFITGQGFAGTPTLIFSGQGTTRELTYATLSPSVLFVTTPELPHGKYTLQVRQSRTGQLSNKVDIQIGEAPNPSPTPSISPTPTPSTTPSPSPTPTFDPNCILQPEGCPERDEFVVLGDSVAVGIGSWTNFANEVANTLERRGERRPRVYNLARSGSKSIALEELLAENSTKKRLGEAEIVAVSIGGNDLRAARQDYKRGTCGGSDNQKCLRTTAAELKQNWNDILRALSAEVQEEATIVALAIYNPYVAEDKAEDSWPDDDVANDWLVFRIHLNEVNRHLARTAGASSIAIIPVAEIFNGSDGGDDAGEAEWLSWDELHPNERAHREISARIVPLLP